MCGRMTLTERDLAEVAAQLGVELPPELAASYRPRFNLPPTDPHLIVKLDGGKRLAAARWGFGRDPARPQINARAETVARNGLFKRAFEERRCLVPADGFFEWSGRAKASERRRQRGEAANGDPGARRSRATWSPAAGASERSNKRRPIWFHAPPGQLLRFAGIYDEHGFAVITTPANDAVAPVHDRMPAILLGDAADRWLRTPDASLLVPAPADALIVTPVSPRVNSVANDDPACLEPPEEDPQLRLV